MLVAQEYASDGKRDDLFAGSPPLAATKFILRDLASGRVQAHDHGHQKRFFARQDRRPHIH